MEPIAIVKKRSHIWLIMIALIIVALLVAAALWFMGDGAATAVSQAPEQDYAIPGSAEPLHARAFNRAG